jgi:hypothetical protein
MIKEKTKIRIDCMIIRGNSKVIPRQARKADLFREVAAGGLKAFVGEATLCPEEYSGFLMKVGELSRQSLSETKSQQ